MSEEASVLVSSTTDISSQGNVCIRYFTSVTPKDEGSIVFWKQAPTRFSGDDLRKTLIRKDIPLEDHLPQVYDPNVLGYCNLDSDVVIELPKDGSLLRLDVRFTPLVGPEGTKADEVAFSSSTPGLPVLANPGPMALYAFGFTTLMLMLIEVGAVSTHSENLVIGYAMFHGGLVQLIVGFVEIRRNNLFGATAFSSYGAFWLGWGLTNILEEAGVLPHESYPAATCGYLVMWGIFTLALFVQTIYINYCLQAIFFLLTVTFMLLAGGQYNEGSKFAGGVTGIILAIVVFYTATAELYNDMGNLRLPLFHVHRHKEEFGNAHAGRGELLTKNDPAGVIPLRMRKHATDSVAVAV